MPVRDRIVELRRVPAGDLRANPRNWRRHPDAQARALRSVLEQVGYAGALLARETPDGLELIDGHLRTEITPDQEVPVLVLDVDEAEAGLLLASLDPLAAMAETDPDALRDLLESVEIPDEDLARFLEDLSAKPAVVGLTDPDDVPEPPAKPKTKLGDLWLLGEHRLLCGDSTKPDDIDRLMDDDRAALCLTDPPYGNEWNYASTNDTQENLERLVAGFMPLALESADVVMLTPGNANQRLYPPPTWTLCWHVGAGTGSTPWGFSCWQPVLVYGKDPYLAAGMGRRPDALSLTEAAPDIDHPAPKPTTVWRWFMERGCPSTDALVFDPFGGSGTTLVVAELTGRRANLLELDPGYCDVIVKRWESFTGKKAERAKVAA